MSRVNPFSQVATFLSSVGRAISRSPGKAGACLVSFVALCILAYRAGQALLLSNNPPTDPESGKGGQQPPEVPNEPPTNQDPTGSTGVAPTQINQPTNGATEHNDGATEEASLHNYMPHTNSLAGRVRQFNQSPPPSLPINPITPPIIPSATPSIVATEELTLDTSSESGDSVAGAAAAAAAASPDEAVSAAPSGVESVLEKVRAVAEAKYKFGFRRIKPSDSFYTLGVWSKNERIAPSWSPMATAVRAGHLQVEKKSYTVRNIGSPGVHYLWKKEVQAKAMTEIGKNAGIEGLPRLDLNGLSYEKFDEARKALQEGVLSNKGIDQQKAYEFALQLGGVTLSATMKMSADRMLNLEDCKITDPSIHYIFQSGLNLFEMTPAGLPAPGLKSLPGDQFSKLLKDFTQKNAQAAVDAALENKSDLLVFNLGIGAGKFAGGRSKEVTKCNIEGIIAAAESLKSQNKSLKITVPKVPHIDPHLESLKKAGIEVIEADKGAVAALSAIEGLKVSETIAGDPMSMYGVQGQGSWWETCKAISDEERVPFLAPTYPLAYMECEVFEGRGESQVKLDHSGPLSKYMVR